jgi:hypothetical protein
MFFEIKTYRSSCMAYVIAWPGSKTEDAKGGVHDLLASIVDL